MAIFGRNSHAEEVFSSAWQQVRAGRSIESVLAEHPEYADELEPMLRLTAAIRDVPGPSLSPEALARIQQRTEKALEERGPVTITLPRRVGQRRSGSATSLRNGRRSLVPTLRGNLAVLALLLVVEIGAVLAGIAVTHRGSPPRPIESYTGIITKMSATEWLVDAETTMIIDDTTEIHGQPVVGARMTCIAERIGPGERYHALEIWIEAPTVV